METGAGPLRIEGLWKSYNGLEVLRGIDLEVAGRNILCVLGPSGCGKTTLLNIISGMVKPDAGRILGLEHPLVSYVFQEPRLLPWKTVKGNIEFVLKDRMQKQEREAIVRRTMEMVELSDFALYYPARLSGGMKQRVAAARAFAFPSRLLLMDEPFRALDLKLKLQLIASFMAVWSRTRRTVVFVTHDITEAVLMGDEIVVLSERPARVIEKLVNPLAREERSIENTASLTLEKTLYRLILSDQKAGGPPLDGRPPGPARSRGGGPEQGAP